MRYRGGKARIAKDLVKNLDLSGINQIWEPFCGGINLTERLVDTGLPIIASDISRQLIFMYRALQRGWEPPKSVTREDWDNALKLPDTNPLRAFIRIGCSWGGSASGWGINLGGRSPVHEETTRVLKRQITKCKDVVFQRLDFLKIEPRPSDGILIICDPPYNVPHRAFGRDRKNLGEAFHIFDRSKYFERLQQWRSLGARIYLTDYDPPPHDHKLIFTKTHHILIADDHKVLEKKMQTDNLWMLGAA